MVLELLPRSKSKALLQPTAKGSTAYNVILQNLRQTLVVEDETIQTWLAEVGASRLERVRILHKMGIIHRDTRDNNFRVGQIHDDGLFDFGNSFLSTATGDDPLFVSRDSDSASADILSAQESIKFL